MRWTGLLVGLGRRRPARRRRGQRRRVSPSPRCWGRGVLRDRPADRGKEADRIAGARRECAQPCPSRPSSTRRFAALTWPSAVPAAKVLAAMAGLAVICTAVAFIAFFALIAEVGPGARHRHHLRESGRRSGARRAGARRAAHPGHGRRVRADPGRFAAGDPAAAGPAAADCMPAGSSRRQVRSPGDYHSARPGLPARLAQVIDLKAARQDPDNYRAALARRGAAADFDALLAADASWRSLTERSEALRAAQKNSSKGKPTPEQIEQLRQLREELDAGAAGPRRSRPAA